MASSVRIILGKSMQSARGFEYGVRHILLPRSGGLGSLISEQLDIDQKQFEFLLQFGAVYLNSKRISEDTLVKENDYVRVHMRPRRFLPDDGSWKERILHDGEDFLVVNKPSGLPVHASVDNIQENLQRYLERYLGVSLFLTHRLDVPTSGLLVYAKTPEFQSAFNKLLIERGPEKIYLAEVHGHPPTGLYKHYMEPSPRAPKTVHLEAQPGWQECLLEVLETRPLDKEHSLLRIRLLTGRTHQIRAQLSHAGFPIVGDSLYGAEKKDLPYEQISLQAAELSFTHPLSGQPWFFKC